MTTETFLEPGSLEVLRSLVGERLLAYGTDLELDDGVGAFGAWLQLESGWVSLEFVEEVVDFDAADAGFESVESVLTVHPLTWEFPGGDPQELEGTITEIVRVQDRVVAVEKPAETIAWDWWRDSGLRFLLDSGSELLIHCASTIRIEVVMRAGPAGTVEPEPIARGTHQSGEKRRYEHERREAPLR
ncbi:hypothetical protein [Corynebacterium halotolerans]|uniref:Uncharacterized protein n=1 Tax=Corynebacterium halotolerans YIM 70093 = DSM 44683 TaxID=1121362 RepID=M1MU10_9CORY|nr:hypothetical protein [Corynebacterium halotolerans]AGF71194.1 hypothetical protein A605_00890 [Corynebacterium halotolerans YIM 70093 = DSM 44683]